MEIGKRDKRLAPFGNEGDLLSSSKVWAVATDSMSFTMPNVMPGTLTVGPRLLTEKGGRTEAPIEKAKPPQRMRFHIACGVSHHLVQNGQRVFQLSWEARPKLKGRKQLQQTMFRTNSEWAWNSFCHLPFPYQNMAWQCLLQALGKCSDKCLPSINYCLSPEEKYFVRQVKNLSLQWKCLWPFWTISVFQGYLLESCYSGIFQSFARPVSVHQAVAALIT